MGKRLMILLGLALVVLAFAACGGGPGITPPPVDGFDKMSARVLGTDGAPLAGLAIRVEGQDTGVVTNASGAFELTAGAFPNGVEAVNEITLGRNGVVLGSRDVVPTDNTDLLIKFDEAGTGTGTLSGVVRDETTGTALSGVQLTLFSSNGGLLQANSASGGDYNFSGVAAGSWQLIAFIEGYSPEMSFLSFEEGATLTQDLGLTPDGAVTPGTGIKVRGRLVDSKTGAGISGAYISVMADTGYMGIPETGVYDDVKNAEDGRNSDGSTGNTGGGATEPMPMPASDDAIFTDPAVGGMPWRYDPQYQETTTGADGSFEFEKEVIGYSLWFSYSAAGYLASTYYENIDGRTSDVDVELTLDPIVETSFSGTVVDEEGNPVEGAYVEFIFAGNMGGAIDYAVPPTMDLGDIAQDGTMTRDNTGSPPPPVMNGGGGDADGAGWDDFASAPESDSSDDDLNLPGGAGGGESSGDPNMDNMLMQKFRFENQNGREASDVQDGDIFNGYLSTTTGADGTFNFTDAPAGDYYVFATAYKHLTYSGVFTAEEDPADNANSDITLPNVPVGSVEGTITDESGLPIPDVLVNATQPNVDPFTYSDASGNYRIDNVPAGTWTISGYKQGFLTVSSDTEITEDGVAHVNLTLHHYTPPVANLVVFTGTIRDGSKWQQDGTFSADSGVGGADLLFTPVDPNLGSYFQHVLTDGVGTYSATLVNTTDYTLHVQAPGFQDLDIRLWADATWPTLDFQLWPIGGMPGGGGVIIGPPGTIEPGGGGGDPGTGGGGNDGDEPDSSGDGEDPRPL